MVLRRRVVDNYVYYKSTTTKREFKLTLQEEQQLRRYCREKRRSFENTIAIALGERVQNLSNNTYRRYMSFLKQMIREFRFSQRTTKKNIYKTIARHEKFGFILDILVGVVRKVGNNFECSISEVSYVHLKKEEPRRFYRQFRQLVRRFNANSKMFNARFICRFKRPINDLDRKIREFLEKIDTQGKESSYMWIFYVIVALREKFEFHGEIIVDRYPVRYYKLVCRIAERKVQRICKNLSNSKTLDSSLVCKIVERTVKIKRNRKVIIV